MSMQQQPSGRGGVLVRVVALAAAIAIAGLFVALGVYFVAKGWRGVDRVTPAPDSVPSFELVAGFVIAVVLGIGIFVASYVPVALSDRMALVFLTVLSLGISLYLLYRPARYAGRYSCGSWLAPSRYVRGYNISGYCVAHLGASFRWAGVIAAIGLACPVLTAVWYMAPQDFRDRFAESDTSAA